MSLRHTVSPLNFLILPALCAKFAMADYSKSPSVQFFLPLGTPVPFFHLLVFAPFFFFTPFPFFVFFGSVFAIPLCPVLTQRPRYFSDPDVSRVFRANPWALFPYFLPVFYDHKRKLPDVAATFTFGYQSHFFLQTPLPLPPPPDISGLFSSVRRTEFIVRPWCLVPPFCCTLGVYFEQRPDKNSLPLFSTHPLRACRPQQHCLTQLFLRSKLSCTLNYHPFSDSLSPPTSPQPQLWPFFAPFSPFLHTTTFFGTVHRLIQITLLS